MQGKNRGGKNVRTSPELQRLKNRYARLAAQLAKPGLLLQGTISERFMTRPDPQDPEHPKTIGPYYQWTFKRKAKTVTVNLSAAQAGPFQKAMDNNRRLETLLTEMRELSREILDASTEGVQRRKSRL
jgi:hypothetical protein